MSIKALALRACFRDRLVMLFPFTRYGNERMDYYSPAELAGVRALYRPAPHARS